MIFLHNFHLYIVMLRYHRDIPIPSARQQFNVQWISEFREAWVGDLREEKNAMQITQRKQIGYSGNWLLILSWPG